MRVRNATDIGAIIRDRRQALSLGQAELAERVGVSRLWLGALENGKATVQLDLVLRTLATLDLPVDIGSGDAPKTPSRSAELIRRAIREL